ncbi:MAG TPA: ATP-binding protein [Gammaproteobacteria bacterium]
MIDLVRAGVKGDTDRLRTVAAAIAADERAKKHDGVADRIARALESASTSNGNALRRVPRSDGSTGIVRREPCRPLALLHLATQVRSACDELIEEQRRADVLRAHGLEPRHRVLLSGPPGNGKTSLAECLAYELSLPFFVVRYDAVVTSYLGETAQRLRKLFDFVQMQPCVLFFDEFDAIAKERGDIHETGEIKRVVTTFLLQLDDLPSYCVVVAATNHPELLDRATWRRFQLHLELDRPSNEQLQAYFAGRLKEFSEPPGYTAKRLCSVLRLTSFSEAENFFSDLHRRWVLNQGAVSLRTVIDDRVRVWRQRPSSPESTTDDARAIDPSTSQST